VLAPRTRIAVGARQLRAGALRRLDRERWKSGIGFALGIEYRLNDGPNDATARARFPTPGCRPTGYRRKNSGVQLRWLRMSPDRSRVSRAKSRSIRWSGPSTFPVRHQPAGVLKSGAEHGIGRRLDAGVRQCLVGW
jgi:hypothetical protein